MDHFVVVTGVDYGRGVVTINDSARSAGLEIPIDVLSRVVARQQLLDDDHRPVHAR